MSAQEKKNTSWLEILENIQRSLFYISVLVIPISIIPLPWDTTEFSMGLVLAVFSTIVITLELIKLVYTGRILIPKASIDLGVLAILLSTLISTGLSKSLPTSLWGYDFRLGSGAILAVLAFIYIYSARSFLFKSEEVINVAKFLIIGTFISALFSIVSFFGVNILQFIPSFDVLFTKGLPLFSSSRISVIVWGVSFLLSFYLSANSFKSKTLPFFVFSILSTITHLLAIYLFSIAQGWEIFTLITIALIYFIYRGVYTSASKKSRAYNLVIYAVAGITILAFITSQIPYIRSGVGNFSKSLVTQITISNDSSLKIVTQVLSKDILSTLVGIGHDTFSISFNQYRPLNDQTSLVNGTNFTNATNQIFNILANRGLIGLASFLILCYFTFKYVVSNNKERSDDENYILLFDIITIFILLTSIFVYHNFIINFLFLLVLSMSVSLKGILKKDKLEVYVINWGIFTHSNSNAGLKNASLGVVALFAIIGILLNITYVRLGISAYNTLQAERITAKARIDSNNLKDHEKEAVLKDAINYYANAISYNKNNDVLHRRASLILSQYLEMLAAKYEKAQDEEQKKEIFESIATYVEISSEEAKKATDLAPTVYANWSARSTVYSKLVGLGLTSYTKSALSALQNSANLNPLNYDVYYNAAQLYVLNNESDNALRTLNQLFSINPNHIPSLILAGEISTKDKDLKQAERFFTDAKKVMEETSSTDNEIYRYIVKRLKEIEDPSKVEEQKVDNSAKSTQKDDLQGEEL